MKFIKNHKFIFLLIFCFILGFLTSPLFHSGYIETLFKSYKSIKWYYHILLFLLMFFTTLILHELTHALTFNAFGYKNEILILLFFVFIRKNKKWKVKIDFKLLLLFGGLAFPSLDEINNDNDYSKAKKAIKSSLISAPVFTLISGILFIILTFIFFYKIPLLVSSSIYVLIFSLLYTYVSTKETSDIKGDFKAYKHMKTDNDFATLIIIQYSKPTSYMYNVAKETIYKINNSNDLIFINLFNFLLDYQINGISVDYDIYKLVYPYNNNNTFNSLLIRKNDYKLSQSILLYLYKANFKSDVRNLFEIFKNKLLNEDINDKQIEYLYKQTSHLLGYENHKDFIMNEKNIQNDNLHFITKHIPSFIQSEIDRNKGIKPFILKCKIK